MAYVAHILVMIGIYSIAVLGLRLATCYGAVLVVTPTVAFAFGAYSTGILSGMLGWPVSASLIAGVFLGAAFGSLIGLLTWRLDGDYLLLASLGVCEIVRALITNLNVTGGSIGIMNIPSMVVSWSPQMRMPVTLVVVGSALVACVVFSVTLRNSGFGRVQVAMHGDALGAASLGQPVKFTKLLSASVGAAWTALAGVLFASYSTYIDPSSFTVDEAITIFAMFVLGGMRSVWSSILGSAVFLALPELLRLFGLPSNVASPLRRVLCGALLLVFMRARLLSAERRGMPSLARSQG